MLAFVMGTGRCGTTLVQEVLARHAGVGFVSNLDDKLRLLNLSGRWNGPIYRRMSARDPRLRPFRDRRGLLERGRVRIAPSEGWLVLDRQVMSGFSKPCRDLLATDATPYLRRRLRAFFDARMAAQGCDVLVHRLTGWPRTGFLSAAYPDMRVINVIRDGRAVANSLMQMGWWDGWRGPSNWYLGPMPPAYDEQWHASGRSFPVLAGLGWRMLMEAFDEARAAFPADQWLDVRYEDVLADPRRSYGRMLDFLGLDWSPEFEAGLARHRFEESRVSGYLRDLDERSLALMERSIGDTLERWGYERLVPAGAVLDLRDRAGERDAERSSDRAGRPAATGEAG